MSRMETPLRLRSCLIVVHFPPRSSPAGPGKARQARVRMAYQDAYDDGMDGSTIASTSGLVTRAKLPVFSTAELNQMAALEIAPTSPLRRASPATRRWKRRVRAWWADARQSPQFWVGVGLLVMGFLSAIGAGLVATKGSEYRQKKIAEALVVDGARNANFVKWSSSDTASKTAVYHSYCFFNLTNPREFLSGAAPPIVQELGPFSFKERSKKQNVSFTDGGRLVSYVQLYQYEYQGDAKDLDQTLNIVELPYVAAINMIRGESNILKLGARQALTEMKEQMEQYFVPTLRENALVTAIKQSASAMNVLDSVQQDAVRTLWGGGCIKGTFGLFRYCGFGPLSAIVEHLGLRIIMDINLMQLSLNTKLSRDENIPEETVVRLWNETNPFSILNVDRANATVRYGISYWLFGGPDIHAQLQDHFKLSSTQFETLRAYLLSIYHSPLLEKGTTRTFKESLSPDDAAAAQIRTWNDFVVRQWLRGDVIGRLKAGRDQPFELVSVQPDNPPELAFYAQSTGVTAPGWGPSMAVCLFNIAKRPLSYFQTEVLGLTTSRINRAEFMSQGLEPDVATADIHRCFTEQKDWELLRGYLGHIGQKFVVAEFQKQVIVQNGGLVTQRSIRELIFGHQSPILKLSLSDDDPRAHMFALSVNDASLDGPARCRTSADVGNPYTSCALAGFDNVTRQDGTNSTFRVWGKVPHTFYTGGGGQIDHVGAWSAYHGDTLINMWPNGSYSLRDVLYSDGTQFPPFGAVERPDAVLHVFVPNFVLPLTFVFQKDVHVQGIKLKRFVLAPDTFSSRRSDASIFGMDATEQEGLFNLTDLSGALSFLTKPHARGSGRFDMADIEGLYRYDSERDDSYIDIEPTTGKTMNARIQLQVSLGLDNGAYDSLYTNVYPAAALPVLYMSQHATISAEDAAMFRSQVYRSERLLATIVSVAAALAGVGLGLGIVLVVTQGLFGDRLFSKRPESVKRRSSEGQIISVDLHQDGL